MKAKPISAAEQSTLLQTLKERFEKNMHRHKGMKWEAVEAKLKKATDKIQCLYAMESSGGEPDVVQYDKKEDSYVFFDCAAESPKERRSLCYDAEALAARKENKPKGSAMQAAKEMGIEILNEEQYRYLQQLGNFDLKTSSWLQTPAAIRKLGGSIFGDRRYDTVFIYHNGAESYYAARGFRGCLKL